MLRALVSSSNSASSNSSSYRSLTSVAYASRIGSSASVWRPSADSYTERNGDHARPSARTGGASGSSRKKLWASRNGDRALTVVIRLPLRASVRVRGERPRESARAVHGGQRGRPPRRIHRRDLAGLHVA